MRKHFNDDCVLSWVCDSNSGKLIICTYYIYSLAVLNCKAYSRRYNCRVAQFDKCARYEPEMSFSCDDTRECQASAITRELRGSCACEIPDICELHTFAIRPDVWYIYVLWFVINVSFWSSDTCHENCFEAFTSHINVAFVKLCLQQTLKFSLCTPWIHMGDWKCSYAHFYRRHEMKACGLLHELATLLPERQPLVHVGYEGGWTGEQVLTVWRSENLPHNTGNRTTIPRSVSIYHTLFRLLRNKHCVCKFSWPAIKVTYVTFLCLK
jgi:hypothetical protein